jgi:hypothetical protein
VFDAHLAQRFASPVAASLRGAATRTHSPTLAKPLAAVL